MPLRIGIVGLGANTRLRHVPGLRACADVVIQGVCNRTRESSQRAAREFDIPQTYDRWTDLVADDQIDAVVIGTWPYLHCPITVAALDAGKHVLTEARMAATLDEARQMLEASRRHHDLVTQIVPSPFGLRAGAVVKEMIADGYLGELRELVVLGVNDALADPAAPLHWRQQSRYSGINMLVLGILHETALRFVADPLRVCARTCCFTLERRDAESGEQVIVDLPDSVHVMTELPSGAAGLYHLSSAVYHGAGMQIHLYGSQGTIKYLISPEDRLLAGRAGEALEEVSVPDEKAGGWRVEQDFVEAIRGQRTIELTDFAAGLRYMQFTDAVARSAQSGQWVKVSGGA